MVSILSYGFLQTLFLKKCQHAFEFIRVKV